MRSTRAGASDDVIHVGLPGDLGRRDRTVQLSAHGHWSRAHQRQREHMANIRRRYERDAIVTGGPASHLHHVDDVTPMPVRKSEGWEQVDIRFLLPPELQQEGALLALFRAVFPPGARHLAHTHPNAPEFVYVVAGEPVIGDANGERIGRPGTVQLVPAGAIHWLWNTSETTVEVLGGYLGVRTFDDAGYQPIIEPPA